MFDRKKKEKKTAKDWSHYYDVYIIYCLSLLPLTHIFAILVHANVKLHLFLLILILKTTVGKILKHFCGIFNAISRIFVVHCNKLQTRQVVM